MTFYRGTPGPVPVYLVGIIEELCNHFYLVGHFAWALASVNVGVSDCAALTVRCARGRGLLTGLWLLLQYGEAVGYSLDSGCCCSMARPWATHWTLAAAAVWRGRGLLTGHWLLLQHGEAVGYSLDSGCCCSMARPWATHWTLAAAAVWRSPAAVSRSHPLTPTA